MNKEILFVVDSISNEKGVEGEVIFSAIEKALEAVTARRYDQEVDIRVAINRKSGDYETFRRWTIIADDVEIEFPGKQIPLSKAKAEIDEDLEIGDVVEEPIESIEFGRIAAQQAKQVIMREIRRAEREDIARRYREQVGSLMMGVVKKVSRDSIILDMGSGVEAIILKEEMLPRESARIGDRKRGVLYEVREDKGPLLFLSRTRPEMLLELFKLEVPEINEDVINIKAIARDPGLRAKIAVKTNDGRIDPIGACIGIRGSRVQNVSNELGGERIDVILWDDDPAQMVVNSMAPAEIASIVVDEEKKSMDIAVREDQLALAIGRNGQNVKLASELCGWRLNVISVKDAEKKIQTEATSLMKVFTDNLDVDEDVAGILVREGFRTLEDVAYAPVEDLTNIEGFDQEIAEALRNRARDVLLEQALSSKGKVGAVEPAQDLLELEGMSRHLAYVLASRGIVTREDLADQAVDDLSDIEELSPEEAAKLIMTARKPWFEGK